MKWAPQMILSGKQADPSSPERQEDYSLWSLPANEAPFRLHLPSESHLHKGPNRVERSTQRKTFSFHRCINHGKQRLLLLLLLKRKNPKGSPPTDAQRRSRFICGTQESKAGERWGPASPGGWGPGLRSSPHCLKLNQVVNVTSGCPHFLSITNKHIQKNKSRATAGPANHPVFLLAFVRTAPSIKPGELYSRQGCNLSRSAGFPQSRGQATPPDLPVRTCTS